ncbi:MAG: hypothetical protein LBB55_05155, partial [Zoogloeaceae bacterium]|nr:hypothetical protein [Zoogloeaceae bacterium]
MTTDHRPQSERSERSVLCPLSSVLWHPRLTPGLWACLPLAGLFAALAALRRCYYRLFPPKPLP